MARSRNDSSNPIPQEWRDEIGDLADEPAYIAAWRHAAAAGNPNKACRVYADNKWQDYESEQAPTAESVQAEIDRLTAQKEQLEGSAS